MDIHRRVYNLVKKYDTCNPYQLARDLKITIGTYQMPSNIRGCYSSVLRRKHIGLSDKLTDEAIKIVLCHELGHARLHRAGTFSCSITPRQRIRYKPEFEANIFALNLLSYSNDFDLDIIQNFIKEKHPTHTQVHQILKELIMHYSI
ncbi:ImmA/IrrE family metallo-endopeptidase [bacterium BFN5]|nr:ImmA/IrrE family metallo-endopeptidase [bacterium BFN5]QJW44551.1 ImmA/IrrE family metallo-endopeptidase [bacterium BFN5]